METANLYDRVRSFDFPNVWGFPDPNDTSDNPAPTHKTGFDLEGERACYFEGKVIGLVEPNGEPCPVTGYKAQDCTRVCISVDRHIFRGVESPSSRVPEFVYPPQNGVAKSMGGLCCGIQIIEVFDRDALED